MPHQGMGKFSTHWCHEVFPCGQLFLFHYHRRRVTERDTDLDIPRERIKRRQINESHGSVELIPEGQPDGGHTRAIHDYVCLVPKDIRRFTERAISTIVHCTRGIGLGVVRMARDDLLPTQGPELEKTELAACIVREVVRWFEQAGTGLKLHIWRST